MYCIIYLLLLIHLSQSMIPLTQTLDDTETTVYTGPTQAENLLGIQNIIRFNKFLLQHSRLIPYNMCRQIICIIGPVMPWTVDNPVQDGSPYF